MHVTECTLDTTNDPHNAHLRLYSANFAVRDTTSRTLDVFVDHLIVLNRERAGRTIFLTRLLAGLLEKYRR